MTGGRILNWRPREIPQSMIIYLVANIVLVVVGTVSVFIFSPPLSSVGSAILASGIVGFVYYGYQSAEARYDEMVRLADEWGILDIHGDRNNKDRYKQYLLDCDDVLHIQAITLRRFYTDLGDVVENLGKSDVEIQLLLLDPESDIRKWVEEADAEYSDLATAVQSSTEKFESLDTENVEVRYYDGFPTNYFRVDDRAFVGPYFAERPSRTTVTYLTELNKSIAEQYRENFEDYWENHSRHP